VAAIEKLTSGPNNHSWPDSSRKARMTQKWPHGDGSVAAQTTPPLAMCLHLIVQQRQLGAQLPQDLRPWSVPGPITPMRL